VTVRVPAPEAGIEEKVRRVLPNALDVRQEWPRRADAAAATGPAAARDPQHLFAAFHRRELQAEPPPALLALFAQLHEDARDEAP